MSYLLENKKILFFTQKFFDYENIVCKEMQRQGAVVHFYDERANVNTFEKIIIKLAPCFLHFKISKYYELITLKEKSFCPDYILFVTTTIVSPKDIKKMRLVFPKAVFILHLWDSVKNTNAKSLYKLFDRCLSFDDEDCRRYGFIFRPNFFVPSKQFIKNNKEYKYDFAFVGTIHSDRAKILYKLETFFKQEGYKYYFYFYIQGKIMLIFRYLFNRYFRKLNKQNVHMTALSREKFNEIIDDTLYLIDISHPNQNGLTMRPFDMLYKKRKILTVDESIKKYDFYRPLNQLIFNRRTLKFDNFEISTDYNELPNNIVYEYSIEKWIIDIFTLQKGEHSFFL